MYVGSSTKRLILFLGFAGAINIGVSYAMSTNCKPLDSEAMLKQMEADDLIKESEFYEAAEKHVQQALTLAKNGDFKGFQHHHLNENDLFERIKAIKTEDIQQRCFSELITIHNFYVGNISGELDQINKNEYAALLNAMKPNGEEFNCETYNQQRQLAVMNMAASYEALLKYMSKK